MADNHGPNLHMRGMEFGSAASVYAAHDGVGPLFVNFHPQVHAAMVFFGGPVASLDVELTQDERNKLMDFLGTFWTEVSERWMKEKLGADETA